MQDMAKKCQGKTKIVWVSPSNPGIALLEALDVVTWNNDRQEPMKDKGIWATTTTVSVFRVLAKAGIPVAFTRQTGSREFEAPFCTMIPLEVIVRGVAEEHSSYLKRNPEAVAGTRFAEPVVEFFLKTDEKEFRGVPLPDIDPYIGSYTEHGIKVYRPKRPPEGGVILGRDTLGWDDQYGPWPFEQLGKIARIAFVAVRDSWAKRGFELLDWKVEFGYGPDGALLLADVIDNDSWRIRGPDGREYSKQNIRNGMDIEQAARDYAYVAEQSVLMLTSN